ncbi:unnamed protein product [Cyprideis torosa]|uniref:Uncharacterized protein n=1 Tax=Cyprideis torosa TaxID=163714 RepID=A0A7R8ZR21_9CRUS|nr:unnamed protein product [Cyprideis torosa]CAG0893295.1 unnamed protein product [Cyprideis torosa]
MVASPSANGTVVFLTVDWVPSYKFLILCDSPELWVSSFLIQATLSYSSDKQKLTVVVHRCCNLPMEPDDPEELPDPYVKCYLNPGTVVFLTVDGIPSYKLLIPCDSAELWDIVSSFLGYSSLC